MGRLPNHPENPPARKNKVLVQPQKLALTHDQPVPRIPSGYNFTRAGKDYWKKVWESPMGPLYIDADVPLIVRACMLTDMIHNEDVKQGILAELRQLEDRIGMSPLGRRHLQWDIDRANGLHDTGDEPEKQDDDRFLRVVGD